MHTWNTYQGADEGSNDAPNTCAHGTLTRELMKGAMMPPIRAHMEHAPMPTLRYSVGKISAEYTYTMAKAAAIPNLPTRLRVTISHSISVTKMEKGL